MARKKIRRQSIIFPRLRYLRGNISSPTFLAYTASQKAFARKNHFPHLLQAISDELFPRLLQLISDELFPRHLQESARIYFLANYILGDEFFCRQFQRENKNVMFSTQLSFWLAREFELATSSMARPTPIHLTNIAICSIIRLFNIYSSFHMFFAAYVIFLIIISVQAFEIFGIATCFS